MKSAKEIIGHIANYPSYKELKSRGECADFTRLLGKNFSRLVSFCYVKNGILFFAMLHPAGLQEFKRDSSINMIRSLLKTYNDFNKNTILSDVKDIKFFVTYSLKFRKTRPQPSKILFIEPSRGNFKNLAKNEKIYEKFERIRRAIKSNLRESGEKLC